MSKKQDKSNPLSDYLREKADVAISDQDRKGGLSIGEVVSWRHWFASRQQLLQSSGGRPTNPSWTIKRQIPFAVKVWEDLEERARHCSTDGARIGPGQVAAFLLEDAVLDFGSHNESTPAALTRAESGNDAEEEVEDASFNGWEMPEIFSGVAA